MNDWIIKNAWALIIAAVTVVGNYAVTGYQISDINRRLTTDEAAITALNTQQVQTQVSLGQIQVSLSYIQASIDHLSK